MASPPTPGALGYRYGLYPFVAENDDEISFQPGERIEILEQDDQYGDGWWQVCIYPSALCDRMDWREPPRRPARRVCDAASSARGASPSWAGSRLDGCRAACLPLFILELFLPLTNEVLRSRAVNSVLKYERAS